MTNAPGISLVMPAYNASRYLREAIDSVLSQTLPPRQVIVVDDDSTDDTLAIARGYGDAVVAITKPNSGTAKTRNAGLAVADQPFITFLDADDRLLPNKLELQMAVFEEKPATMFCVCRVLDFWSPDLPDLATRNQRLVPQFRMGQASSWLLRRELLDRVGIFDATSNFVFAEGSELFTRIESSGCEIARIEDVLVERRLHASNKTTDTKAHLDGIMSLMHSRLKARKGAL